MSANSNLQLFAQQLASWAEQIIENGRTPFRRVDLFHPLHTAAGPCSPPLIFWINRQSMIAGGIIFLPPANDDLSLKREAAAAAALGLRNFITWETESINIWETGPGENRRVSTLPLSAATEPAIFHHRLYEIIDQLKLLSVTGRIATQDISPYYLLNLIDETLHLAYPALLERCRLQRSEQAFVLPAEEEADNWNKLCILRLLCLLHWQRLPANLAVEHFSSTLGSDLDQLPAPLGECLQSLAPGPHEELPLESAVALHHLILRIQQIGWPKAEAEDNIFHLLLKNWYGPPKGYQTREAERFLLHSRELAPSCRCEISHSGAQLAANTLWRTLHLQPHPTQIQGGAFKVNLPFATQKLHANFHGSLRPEPVIKREMAGHLRSSWPNRKLAIPGNLPLWVSEAAHTLGLTAPNCALELHLPGNWLILIRDTFFAELLFTNFTLKTLEFQEDGRQLLKLGRRQNEELTLCFMPDGSQRTVELGQDPPLAHSRLRYALELSPRLFDLVKSGELKALAAAGEEQKETAALLYFSQSSLGRKLWGLQTGAMPPAEEELVVQEGLKFGWLVPDLFHLQDLKRLLNVQQSPAEIDLRIEHLLNLPKNESFDQGDYPAPHETQLKQVSRSFAEDLLHQLKIEGIPQFPQTYLYQLATGPLQQYQFTPPLKLNQELLGEYELEDAQGRKLQITGEETKDALLLASGLNLSSLEIPQDRQQTAAMIDRYRQDLLQLQEKMTRLCHQHIEQLPAAQRLQKKLWQQLPLPPLKWLSH
jgi:hypothetical protein